MRKKLNWVLNIALAVAGFVCLVATSRVTGIPNTVGCVVTGMVFIIGSVYLSVRDLKAKDQ